MDIKTVLGAISVFLAVPSYGFYIYSVFKKSIKPHMYSWLIWSILAAVGFAGQISDNAGPGAWNTGVTALGCFTIFLVAIKKGERKLLSIDKFLLAVAIVAVITRIVSNSFVLSTLMATVAAVIGFALTFMKAYRNPDEETPLTFFVNACRNFISLFALNSITFLTFFYPFTVMTAGLSIVAVIMIRRKLTSS